MKSLLFSFEGRANRAKFWLVNLGVIVVEAILFGVAGGGAMMSMPDATTMAANPAAAMGGGLGAMGWIAILLCIPLVWVALAIAVKRWHDRNKTGWWILIALVPVIGGLWYLIECGFLAGTAGPNKYGADPLSTV